MLQLQSDLIFRKLEPRALGSAVFFIYRFGDKVIEFEKEVLFRNYCRFKIALDLHFSQASIFNYL